VDIGADTFYLAKGAQGVLEKLRASSRVKKALGRIFLIGGGGLFDVIDHKHVKGERALLQPKTQLLFDYR
jgi:hypothetical protein